MGAVIFAGIILAICIAAVLIGIFALPSKVEQRYGDPKPNPAKLTLIIVAAFIGLVVPAGIVGLAGNHSVPAKSVGVVTSYGKVTGEYGPGRHWIWPTKGLSIVQDTKQSDSFLQTNSPNCQAGQTCADTYTPAGATGSCITIRLAGGLNGCADVRVQTQTDSSAVPSLYANYSSYGPNLTQDVDRYVVKTDLTTVLIRALGDYNPIQDYSAQLEACDLSNAKACTSTTSEFSQFDNQLTTQLQAMLGNEVRVFYVNLQNIHYDPTVEAALSKIQTAYEDTAIAVQQRYTNAATSLANAALAKNNTLTPQVLANECYTVIQDAIKANYQLPATYNCNGSSNSGVLVNTK